MYVAQGRYMWLSDVYNYIQERSKQEFRSENHSMHALSFKNTSVGLYSDIT